MNCRKNITKKPAYRKNNMVRALSLLECLKRKLYFFQQHAYTFTPHTHVNYKFRGFVNRINKRTSNLKRGKK